MGGEEQLALEQLAAFSLLARWVGQPEVDRVPGNVRWCHLALQKSRHLLL